MCEVCEDTGDDADEVVPNDDWLFMLDCDVAGAVEAFCEVLLKLLLLWIPLLDIVE